MLVLRLPVEDFHLGFESLELETPLSKDASESKKILFLIAVCSDNYIRFFNLQSLNLSLSYTSGDMNGTPLCFDINNEKNLMSVGFEDDSFIVYHFSIKEGGKSVEIIPVVRGVGHRNFISCMKFDTYFHASYLSYLQSKHMNNDPWAEQFDNINDVAIEGVSNV